MTRTRRRVFYGWWVVLTSALGLFLGPIPIVVFSFGVFLAPLAQEFHSGRGAVSLSRTLNAMVSAFGVSFAGQLADRFGARRVILPATFLSGLILFSAYFCSKSIWQLYLFYVALGLSSSGSGPVPYCQVVSHWFDRRRGLALGIMMLGLGAGALIMPSAAQYLIAAFGWRITFGIVGAAILLITLPIAAIFLVERPESRGLLPDGSPHPLIPFPNANADVGLTWREAWHARTFWFLFGAVILVSASVQACFAHTAAILSDRGASAQAAALATSLFGGGLLVGRTGSGYLLDRFFAPRVAAILFSCAAAGMGLLAISGSQKLAFTAAFLIGLGLGAEVDIMAYLTSRYFGLRSFGALYGFTFAGFGLSGGLGAYLMAVGFDARGSYALELALCSIATLTGAALMLCLGPYRYRIRTHGKSSSELEMLQPET
jgi:MFS family permease